MTNKEKYEGKIVDIYAPFGGRRLDRIKVIEVIGEKHLYGKSTISKIETAYCLSDGLTVKFV